MLVPVLVGSKTTLNCTSLDKTLNPMVPEITVVPLVFVVPISLIVVVGRTYTASHALAGLPSSKASDFPTENLQLLRL